MSLVAENEVAEFRNSGAFDEKWYLDQYPDVKLTGMDPAKHYLWLGKKLGRKPRPEPDAVPDAAVPQANADPGAQEPAPDEAPADDFRTRRRQESAAQIASAQQRRKSHFATLHARVRDELQAAREWAAGRVGAAAPRPRANLVKRLKRSHPLSGTVLFDRQWLKKQTGKAPSFRQYLTNPAFRRVSPHPLFDAASYLDRYPDVDASGVSALEHYLEWGWRQGYDPHPYFTNDWYLHRYPDVLQSGLNPLEHYLLFGWKEGRNANPIFDPQAYLDRHADVKAANLEPLTHYVVYGRAEEREVPIWGLERDWRSLTPQSRERVIMDHLLFDDAPIEIEEEDMGWADDQDGWPPRPLNDYWMPQTLRDFIVENYGEQRVAPYWFLCSVMNAFAHDSDRFQSSPVCDFIVDHVRQMSAERSQAAQGAPAASIIVPVYNNFLDTLLCLASVFESDPAPSFEIIVADDGSSDSTATMIPSIGGVVRHVRQPSNLGFLENCNTAAEEAKGETIVLLNNDTLVLPGWLEGLLAPFTRAKGVGLVGSKLLNADGTLQEAGGIFWRDGSAWNFGRGSDARAPEFNYLKDADYCSGASIAVPTSLWREFGGFDPTYAPAYCEDADLAFRIRKAGFRTIYNPQSAVIHHEGRSHGRDLNSGGKAYQSINQRKFFRRWEEVLERDHFPNAQNVLRARDRSQAKAHVLVIDHYIPQWDQDAGSRTMFQYLEILVDLGFQVTFWPDNLYHDPVYTPPLQAMGVEVIYGPRFRDGFAKFIEERGDLYDAVLLSRPHVAIEYLPALKEHSRARILYYGHDLHFRRMEARRELGEDVDSQQIKEMRDLELGVCRQCDVIFYPDPAEVAAVAEEIGEGRAYIPNPVFVYDEAQIKAGREHLDELGNPFGTQLFFVGGFNHTPNREGILWFVKEVLPLIGEQVPAIHFDIAGSNPPPDVVALQSDRVSVLGRISDERLDELYRSCALAVAPLRHGAGVKGKVIEAMALGVPVATTSVGAQGIDADCLFVGDSPEELATAVVGALKNRSEASKRATRGIEFIEEHYGRDSMMELFRRLILENANA